MAVSRGTKKSRVTHQSAVVYDAISEGPIEGLVNGPTSIILDGNPAATIGVSSYYQLLRSPKASYNATTGVITDIDGNIFQDLTMQQGVRYASVIAGKKRATDAITGVGSRLIRTSSAFFSADDIQQAGEPLNQFIRIAGAGIDGTEYTGQIVHHINSTAVQVDHAPALAVTSANISIDLVGKINAISGSTATFASPGGINTSATAVLISPPATSQSGPSRYNYNNFGWAFRGGEREQPYLGAPLGVGSASTAHGVNAALDQTDLTSIGMPTNATLGIDTDISPNRNGEEGISRVASTGMNIADPGEVDYVRITINHPQMISRKDNGSTGPGFAEYRIVFSFKTDDNDSFSNNQRVIYGRQTYPSSRTAYHANTRIKSGSTGIVSQQTQSPFNTLFSFDISQYQPFIDYKIDIQRVSPVNQKENKWQQTNQSTVSSIENIITDKLTYPYTAYAAVVVDAEDFEDIPERSYDVRGLKVKVPTNYFPRDEIHDSSGVRRANASYSRNVTTGLDTGSDEDWDGNFRGDKNTFTAASPNYHTVFCNNPVWVFMDLVTNPRYGLGKYVDPDFDFSQIDKYTLYNLAKYCDELVPDGKGGTEPRFTSNLYIQKGQDALRLLKDMSTMIRGMLIWYNGQLSLNSNREKGAIYTFGKSNVIEGKFEYTGSSRRFRTNEIRVTWNDPDNRFKQAVEIVTDDDNIAETGRVTVKEITALGCTSQGQAHRLGRWHLLTEKLEKELVSFKTGINGGALVAGDVILIQDADDRDVQFSGRISTAKASTTTVIETDRAISLNENDNFDLHLIYPKGGAYLGQPRATINSVNYEVGDLILEHANGTAISTQTSASQLQDDGGALVQVIWSENQRIETKPISSFNSSNVTVSSAFSSVPDSEVIYAITGQEATGDDVTGSAKEYIITSIKESTTDMQFEITAAEYDLNKFAEVDRGWIIPDIPDIMRPPKNTEVVPPVQDITVAIIPDTEGGDNDDTETGAIRYKALIQWIPPKSIRTDEDGNALDDIYEHLAGFDIEHDIPQSGEEKNNTGFIRHKIRNRGQFSFSISNIPTSDEYRIRVRTVNTQGYTSEFTQTKFTFTPEENTPPTSNSIGVGLNEQIVRGGTLTTGMAIDSSSGLVTFDSSTYSFTPPTGVETINISSGNTNFTQQSFSSLADGEKGFLLFDYDGNLARGSTRSDPLRSLVIKNDNVATSNTSNEPYYFSFLQRLGESNDDLNQANGTITLSRLSSNVTGSSTTFETDFKSGDIIVLDDAGTTRFWTKVAHIESDTEMTLASSSDRAYSGANVFAQSLRFDRNRDSIIAEVVNTGGTFSLVNFASGEKGEDGPPGAEGPVGPTGNPGPQGPDGPPGVAGPVGPTGNPGPTGPDGPTGVAGPTGPTGGPGPTGNAGPPGPDGPTGPTGVAGPTGAAGSAGSPGPDGLSTFLFYSAADKDILDTAPSISAWSSGNNYAIANVVSFNSKVFAAINAITNSTTNPESDTTNFVQVFADGSSAISDMTRLTPTFYNTGSNFWYVVDHSTANRFHANATQVSGGVTGVTHTIIGTGSAANSLTSGNMGSPLVTLGQTGATGATGPTGNPGAPGPDGAQGPAGPTGNPGPTGPDGPTGATGPGGPTGNPGPTGPDGPAGAAGPGGPAGPPGPTGGPGPTGADGPGGPAGPPGATGPDGPDGAPGPSGPPGGTGGPGPTGPAGAAGAVIAFDTNGSATSIPANSAKVTAIQSVSSDNTARSGDIFFHILSNRVFKYSGSGTTFTELDTVSSSGNIVIDGPNSRIIISD